MKLKVTVAAMVACMAFTTQGFGYDLLDRMLGNGCASGCASVAAPACGCDNVAPSCGADAGCGRSWGKCRRKLVDFDVRCLKIPVVVPKINLPKIRLPKISFNRCGTGCDTGCGAAAGCGAGAGCGVAGPSCGSDNAGCGCGPVAAAPACGADAGCGVAAAPSCGADAACGCGPRIRRPGLIDKIRCRMASAKARMGSRRACRAASACDTGCGVAAPACGADAGCGAAAGCGVAAPSCGSDNAGCGCGVAAPACGCDGYSTPAAKPMDAVVPPTPVVDPAAFKVRRNKVIQASLRD